MIYKVKKGDTLSKIVSTLKKQGINTSVNELAQLNNIKNINLIKIGMNLKLPVTVKVGKYKIEKGDTLSGIVRKLKLQGINTSVEALAEFNGIKNVNVIRAGATLLVPGVKPETKSQPISETEIYDRATIKLGDNGAETIYLQNCLNVFGCDCGAVDGLFGVKTDKAFRKWQKVMGMKVTGVCDTAMWKLIDLVEERFLMWGMGFESFYVKGFQGAMTLKPDKVVGKLTYNALVGNVVMPRFTDKDMMCQCVAAGKNYCNGYPAGNDSMCIRIAAERVLLAAEAEKGGKIDAYVPSVKRKTKSGGRAGGYRCTKWNKERKGASGSQHKTRMGAIDIACDNKADLALIKKYGKKVFKYGGKGNEGANIFHGDLRGHSASWSYN